MRWFNGNSALYRLDSLSTENHMRRELSMKKVFYRYLSLALVLGLACTIAFGQEDRDTRDLIVDDYFRIHRVSDTQISPDSNWVAFVVTIMDLEEDDSESRIWMVPADGGEAIPMTSKGSSASRPRWSPEADR